jgi:hypothetical protein
MLLVRSAFLIDVCFKFSIIFFIGLSVFVASDQIVGYHDFRQTQTAMGAREIARGAGWFDSKLPSYGLPWSVPLEFPIYQILVGLLVQLGAPLIITGRLLGAAFFLAVLIPMRGIQRQMKWPDECFTFTAILYCSNPLLLTWSTAFLIESLCLFLGVSWLYFVIRATRDETRRSIAVACAFGILASITKFTIVPAFGLVGLLAILSRDATWRQRALRTLVMIGVPLLGGLIWAFKAEQVRAENPVTTEMWTGPVLRAWTFGPLDQRFSTSFLFYFFEKAPNTIFALALFPILSILIYGIVNTASRRLVLVNLAAYAIAPLIFANLFWVHEYYMIENFLFFVAAVGISFCFCDMRYKNYFLYIFIFIIFFQYFSFAKKYNYYFVEVPNSANRRPIAEAIAAQTGPDTSMIVFFDDHSPSIPFFADRYAVSLDEQHSVKVYSDLVKGPQLFLGDRPLAAVTICSQDADAEKRAIVETFVEGRRLIARNSRCRAYAYP